VKLAVYADDLPPSVGPFEPDGRSGTVGEWVTFITTYTDPNGYDDITWAFFFLDGQPPITDGGPAAVAHVQSGNRMWLKGSGRPAVCRPGQPITLTSDYAALPCRHTVVSGECSRRSALSGVVAGTTPSSS